MKKCNKCGIESDNFGPHKLTKDGLHPWCRDCKNKRLQEYFKTKEGLSAKIYTSERNSSKTRRHSLPSYNLQELRDWLYSQPNFETLYNNWVESNYKTELVPSIDRLDDYKPYTFDNIQLMTWQENKEKAHRDRINGINNKQSKAIIGTHKITGEEIEFHSQNEATRQTGIHRGDIGLCCLGDRNHAGGYRWRFL